jgi:pimeloyl-ACP methyl ester carboxylesterase
MIERPNPIPGITAREIDTPLLRQHVYFSGLHDGVPVLFIHGNCASALHWEESMLALPDGFRG